MSEGPFSGIFDGAGRYVIIVGILGAIVYGLYDYADKKTRSIKSPKTTEAKNQNADSTSLKSSQGANELPDQEGYQGKLSKRGCKKALGTWLYESRQQLQQKKAGDFLYLVALRMGLCAPITTVDLAMFSEKLAPQGNGVKNTITLKATVPTSTETLCDADALNLIPKGYIDIHWEYETQDGSSCDVKQRFGFARQKAFNLTAEQDQAFQEKAGVDIAEKAIKKRIMDPASFVGSDALPEVVRKAIDLNFKTISKCGALGDKCTPGVCPSGFKCFEEYGCAACAINIPERIKSAEIRKKDLDKRKLEAIRINEMKKLKENQDRIPVATAEQEAERNQVMTCSPDKLSAKTGYCKINPTHPCCSTDENACGSGKKCCLSYEKCVSGWSLKKGNCVSVLSYCN